MEKLDRDAEKTGSGKSEPHLKTSPVTSNEGLYEMISYQRGLISKNREAIALAKSRLIAIRSTLESSD